MLQRNKTKIYVCIVLLWVLSQSAAVHAVPACPDPVSFKQPDGTIIQVFTKGDEFLGWSEDAEGNLIVFDDEMNGCCYAEWTEDGPVSTGELVGNNVARAELPISYDGSGSRRGARTRGGDVHQRVRERANETRQEELTARESLIKSISFSGLDFSSNIPPIQTNVSALKRNVLIIHVTWSDRTGIYTPKLTGDLIYNLVFNPSTNSVNSYYKELIGANEDVIIPATVSNPLNGMQGVIEVTLPGRHTNPVNQQNPRRELMSNAIITACSQGLVNLKNFDKNNNGILETTELSIGFIVDGYEASVSNPTTPNFWGVSTASTPSPSYTNGVKIATYFGQGAFHRTSGNTVNDMLTIGVICHELGHSGYGFQDTYDYGDFTGSKSSGQGLWSLMAQGNWGEKAGVSRGGSPAYVDAYNMVRSGLVTPGTANTAETTTIKSHNDIYILRNNVNSRQYFLLQQRKYGSNDNYDRGAFYRMNYFSNSTSGGLLVYHIDESVPLERINDKPTHMRAGIEEAHGGIQNMQQVIYSYNWDQGDIDDLWGVTKKEFSHSSDPSSGLYSAFTNNLTPPNQNTPSGVTLSNITWNSGSGTTSFGMGRFSGSNEINLSETNPADYGIGWTYGDNVYTVNGDVTIKGSTTSKRVVINGGSASAPRRVKLQYANFNIGAANPIIINGYVVLTLEGANYITAGNHYAGIRNTDAHLTIEAIESKASLNVSAYDGAGIGGNGGAGEGSRGAEAGTLVINGGIISVYAGCAAAIGGGAGRSSSGPATWETGGRGGHGGTVIIYEGTVSASSGERSAAIGGGRGGNGASGLFTGENGGDGGNGGTVYIYGGTLTASANNGDGIGCGTPGSGGWGSIRNGKSGDWGEGADIYYRGGVTTAKSQYQLASYRLEYYPSTFTWWCSTSPSDPGGSGIAYPPTWIAEPQDTKFKRIAVLPHYRMSLSEIGTITFPDATESEPAPAGRIVTVSNIGGQPTGNLTVNLSGTTEAFTLSKTTIGSIAFGKSDTFTITPVDGRNLPAGTYTATVTVSGGNVIAQSFNVSYTVQGINAISLNITGKYTFHDAATGYYEQLPGLVTVRNIGQMPTGILDVALSGKDPSAFRLSKTKIDSIEFSKSDIFSVVPITGLNMGNYTATVTVSGSLVEARSFDVSFTVLHNPVTNIVEVPTKTTPGTPLTLSGTVVPEKATYKNIVWSVKNAGNTGAAITGNTLRATGTGTVVVTATIESGRTIGIAYAKDFTISVRSLIEFTDNNPLSGGVGWSYSGGVYTITEEIENCVVINGGTEAKPLRVVLDNVYMEFFDDAPIALSPGAHVLMTLDGANTIISLNDSLPGIETTGAYLTIEAGKGAASLNVKGGADAAGIGGRRGGDGKISVREGNPGEPGGSGGTVVINSGNVTANSTNGAGIGGGSGGNGGGGGEDSYVGGMGGAGGGGGNVAINGGSVIANSVNGTGIGGGIAGNGGRGGDGVLFGNGGGGGDGGKGGNEGAFTIRGGVVVASSYNGVAIGGGDGGKGGNPGHTGPHGPTDSGSSSDGGDGGDGGDVTIKGGLFTASSTSGAAIGGGVGGLGFRNGFLPWDPEYGATGSDCTILLSSEYAWWTNTANSDPGGAGNVYPPAEFVISNDIKFAKIEAKEEKYNLIYNANNGSGTKPADQAGGSVTVSEQYGLYRSAQIFTGWNTRSNGNGEAYQPGDVIELTGDITLYAQWKQPYTLKYDANNGSGTKPLDNSGGSATVSDQLGLYRSGYIFTGWNTQSNGRGTAYRAGQEINLTGNVTLFAQWEQIR